VQHDKLADARIVFDHEHALTAPGPFAASSSGVISPAL